MGAEAKPAGAPPGDFPCWCGAAGSGTARTGAARLDDISQAKLVWKSDPLPGVYGTMEMTGQRGPLVAEGKALLVYHDPNDDVYDAAQFKDMTGAAGWRVREFWDGAKWADCCQGETALFAVSS